MVGPRNSPNAEQASADPLPDFWAEAARLRAETAGRGRPDSTDLVHEERHRRALGATAGSLGTAGLARPLIQP